ncbi:14242_t:CDS:2, partial [Funneliformis geosporum]
LHEELNESKINLQDKLSRELMIWNDVKNYLLAEYIAYYCNSLITMTTGIIGSKSNNKSIIVTCTLHKSSSAINLQQSYENNSVPLKLSRRLSAVRHYKNCNDALQTVVRNKSVNLHEEIPFRQILKRNFHYDESVEDGDENEEECSEDALYYEESQKIIENNGTNYIKSDKTDETEYWL